MCMKYRLLKPCLPAILFLALFTAGNLYSQSSFIEDFDYPEGTLLTDVGWVAYCQPGINPVAVSATGLSFPGYALSNRGGAVRLMSAGEYVKHSFTTQDDASLPAEAIYASFMVAVDQQVSGEFLGLTSATATGKKVRVFINNTSPYHFGLSCGSSTPTYTDGTYTAGKTYLVVLKYKVNDGSSCDDEISMYLFDGAIPAEEPSTPVIGPLTDLALADNIPAQILLRQYDAGESITIDGIRIASDWLTAVTYDNFAPLFSEKFPAVTAIKHNGFNLQVSLNEAGKVFYMVAPAGSQAPSSAEVIAGEGYATVTPAAAGTIDVAAGETAFSADISNLTALSGYDVYSVAQDDEPVPNIQPSPALVTVTTLRTPDASLSDLQVDGTTVTGFTPALLSYTMIYEQGTTAIPSVSFTLNDPEATAEVIAATDLTGSDAARTAQVVVTAYDDETQNAYSISFDPILPVADLTALRAIPETGYDRIYVVKGETFVTAAGNDGVKVMFIQDYSGAGMFVNDIPGKITTSYSTGDGITNLCGTLHDFDGMLGFIPYRDPGEKTSSETYLPEETVTVADFLTNFESCESELVVIKGTAFTDADGSAMFVYGTGYEMTVESEKTIARPLFAGSDLAITTIPYMADVTGVAIWVNSAAVVSPRDAADLHVYSSDATISKLTYNRSEIEILPDTYDYEVLLGKYDITMPKIYATTTSRDATMTIVRATSMTGSQDERTSTVTVTSHDREFTNIYKVIFTRADTKSASAGEESDIYPVPATTQVTLKHTETVTRLELYNASGMKLQSVICSNETEKTLSLDGYPSGFYFIKIITPDGIVMRKFLIQ